MNSHIFHVSVLRENGRAQFDYTETTDQQFLNNLNESHRNFVEFLTQVIIKKSRDFLKRNPHSVCLKIFNPQASYKDIHNFSSWTLMKGFWNYRTKQHNREMHEKAGIKFTPIQELNTILNSFGFIINDISNKKKSFNTVYEIIFVDNIHECPICRENFTPNDIYSTSCSHIFHKSCLLRWMSRSKTCPMCRVQL